jgi:hypothetical protein
LSTVIQQFIRDAEVAEHGAISLIHECAQGDG